MKTAQAQSSGLWSFGIPVLLFDTGIPQYDNRVANDRLF